MDEAEEHIFLHANEEDLARSPFGPARSGLDEDRIFRASTRPAQAKTGENHSTLFSLTPRGGSWSAYDILQYAHALRVRGDAFRD